MSVFSSFKDLMRNKVILMISVLLISAIIYGVTTKPAEVEEVTATTDTNLTMVETTTPASYNDNQSLSLIGNVRAFSEAQVTSEVAGRVVNVNVTLGQSVGAGAIIASLENASQRAAVIQAEGAYDAAVAGASQNVRQNDSSVRNAEISLENAQDGVITAIQGSFNTVNNALVGTIDQFYANPTGLMPGIRISRTDTTYLRNERRAFQTIIEEWHTATDNLSYDATTLNLLTESQNHTERLLQVTDHLIEATSNGRDDTLAGREVTSYTPELISTRGALVNTIQSLRSARNTLTQAEESLQRASIADTSTDSSLTDAQIKQALGSLRAAQANLEKTIIRTPISGTVNSLAIRTGDFINSFAPVAVVANNSALEIITFVSDDELELISEGDEVTIEGEFVGTVTQIAPAVDATTRKTEVRIATEETDIVNGDTVTITKNIEPSEDIDTTIQLPLTAVRFERDDGFIFTIEDGVLVAQAVTLGNILGNSVEVLSGIDRNQEFVVDARGLVTGTEVEIAN
jgi:RND family efflux transporter MFP subunit